VIPALIHLLALQTGGVPLAPPEASALAGSIDHLFYTLTGITVFFTGLIFSLIFYFMVKYRRRSENERPPRIEGSLLLEMTWIVIPLIINIGLFLWAASLYLRQVQPPPGAMEIFVVGKQWMWQLQHAEGPREINALHIPVGVPIKLTMTSEDVIHDFFVPAFRSKMDVLPGRYTQEWFTATQVGTYHLFCAQYCGTLHSGMTGWVYVMKPDDYAAWLQNASTGQAMSATGARVFARLGCGNCHSPDGSGSGPSLVATFGTVETLASGQRRKVDASFIHDKVTRPASLLLANQYSKMPTFKGQLNEVEMFQLIQYLKSLSVHTQTRLGP
jgi:cytochrome c oxidase subunit II